MNHDQYMSVATIAATYGSTIPCMVSLYMLYLHSLFDVKTRETDPR